MFRQKKEKILQEARTIISEFPDGITKEKMFQVLKERGICGSKETFVRYFPEIVSDLHLTKRKTSPKRVVYLTSKDGTDIEQFREKFKIAERLLVLVDKNPTVGDCFYLGEKASRFPKFIRNYTLEVLDHIESDDAYAESFEEVLHHKIIYSRRTETISLDTQKIQESNLITTYSLSLQARRETIENLALFLVNYINDPRNGYSNSTKKECVKIMEPLITKCYEIFQRDYPEFRYCSKQLANKLLYPSNPICGVVIIYSCKSEDKLDLETEFLRILGRFYFVASTNYSIRMQYGSSKKLKTISEFIQTFFHKFDISNKILAESITEEMVKKHDLFESPNPNDTEQVKLLKQVSNALGGKLWKGLWLPPNDPILVAKYYIELFRTLGIFSNLEKKCLDIQMDINVRHKEHTALSYMSGENIATMAE